MSEREAESSAEPPGQTPPAGVPAHPPPQAGAATHEHEACGEGTMERMLNDALGRAARQIKIDPQTGLVLPCEPDDADGEATNGEGVSAA